MRKIKTAAERFWPKVNKTDTCWLWTGAIIYAGYGQFRADGGVRTVAHRWAYEAAHGPIAAGLELDHLCRVRHCVRPDHMEAVPHAENIRRNWIHRRENAAPSFPFRSAS